MELLKQCYSNLIVDQGVDHVPGAVEDPPPDDGGQQHVVLTGHGTKDGLALIIFCVIIMRQRKLSW